MYWCTAHYLLVTASEYKMFPAALPVELPNIDPSPITEKKYSPDPVQSVIHRACITIANSITFCAWAEEMMLFNSTGLTCCRSELGQARSV